jgi:hypothetical protein
MENVLSIELVTSYPALLYRAAVFDRTVYSEFHPLHPSAFL